MQQPPINTQGILAPFFPFYYTKGCFWIESCTPFGRLPAFLQNETLFPCEAVDLDAYLGGKWYRVQ